MRLCTYIEYSTGQKAETVWYPCHRISKHFTESLTELVRGGAMGAIFQKKWNLFAEKLHLRRIERVVDDLSSSLVSVAQEKATRS